LNIIVDLNSVEDVSLVWGVLNIIVDLNSVEDVSCV